MASIKVLSTIRKVEQIQELAGSLSTLIGKADDFRQAINRASDLRAACDSFIKLAKGSKKKEQSK